MLEIVGYCKQTKEGFVYMFDWWSGTEIIWVSQIIFKKMLRFNDQKTDLIKLK